MPGDEVGTGGAGTPIPQGGQLSDPGGGSEGKTGRLGAFLAGFGAGVIVGAAVATAILTSGDDRGTASTGGQTGIELDAGTMVTTPVDQQAPAQPPPDEQKQPR